MSKHEARTAEERAVRRAKKRGVQGMLPFRRWGGARPGAGRPPKGERAGVSHDRRAALAARFPVHVTVRLRRGLPCLRRHAEYAALRAAFAAGGERFGFRLLEYSVQGNHLHLIVEAKDRVALSRGMQGLLVRVARALNRLWGRKGSVFADRFHDRILRTPREVRNALVYCLHNAKKHGHRIAKGIDSFSSGAWFDGWRERVFVRGIEGIVRPVVDARTWLLRVGWRRCGLVRVFERPRA